MTKEDLYRLRDHLHRLDQLILSAELRNIGVNVAELDGASVQLAHALLTLAGNAIMAIGRSPLVTVEVRPHDETRPRVHVAGTEITPRPPTRKWRGDLEPAQVNWPSIGAQEPIVAEAFAMGLILAADMARKMPEEV